MRINQKQQRTSAWISAIAILFLAGSSFGQGIRYDELKDNMTFDDKPVSAVNGEIVSFAPMLEEVTPAVVTIYSKKDPVARNRDMTQQEEILRRLLEQLGGPSLPPGRELPRREQGGLGSGAIITRDGYILTNNHVVDGADRITVTLKGSRKEHPAKVIGADRETDVAIIKIDAKDLNLNPIKIGDSSKVRVGDVVLAVGNPLGLGQTVTHGIVSALNRRTLDISRGGYENFIQTDASINVGNSGGPLIDAQGRFIGMNTAIKTDGFSRGNMGIAFAIPSNMALNIVRKLIDGGGTVSRGFLGIGLSDLSNEKAQELGRGNLKGALVTRVGNGTPAEEAGLQVDDLIVDIDGTPVDDYSQLRLMVSSRDPGDKMRFTVFRDGLKKDFSVVLGDRDKLISQFDNTPPPQRRNQRAPGRGQGQPPQPQDRIDLPPLPDMRNQNQEGAEGFMTGVRIRNIDRNLRSGLGLKDSVTGVFVESVDEGTSASQAGLQAGHLITQVDQENVRSVADVQAIMENFDGEVILLQIYKDERRSILAVPMD